MSKKTYTFAVKNRAGFDRSSIPPFGTPSFSPGRLHSYLIFAILFLALALRIAYLMQTKDNVLFNPVVSGLDPSLYHQRAQLIVQGFALTPDFIYGMPFYPFFLAALYKLFGENILLVRLIQMLLGTLSCLIIYFIAKQVFNQRTALVAMFLFALYGMFIFYEGLLLGTSLSILFIGLIILLLLSIQRRSNLRKWFLLGILVGLCSLNRAGILLFIPLIIIWFSSTQKDRLKIKFCSQLIFCLTIICVIAPISVRNYLIAKDFIPISAHSGINFYIGNNPEADGGFKPPQSMHIGLKGLMADSVRGAQEHTGKLMKPSEVSQFWFLEGLRFMRSQPLRFLELQFRKFALLFNNYEIFDVIDYTFFRERFFTVLNLPLPNLKVILPLAILGITLSLKHWRKCLLLYLFILSYVVSVMAYFVNARYRLPLVPILIIFAGYTFDWWQKMWKNKNLKAIAISLGALLLFSVVTNLKIAQQNYVSQYNNLGVAYKEAGKFGKACEAYNEVLKINPNLAQTHNNLGNLYNAMGNFAKAIPEFQKAKALDPNLAEAYSNLGIAYVEIGKIDQAMVEYKKAIQLRPDLVTTHYNLALLYQQQGKLDLAAKHLKAALQFAPNHIFAHNNLGVIYNTQEKFKLAEDELKLAIALKKDFFQGYYNLGLVYFKQGLFPKAKASWQKVLEIDPDFKPAKEWLNKLKQSGNSRF